MGRNGGKLNPGGTPGNKGGGRPPDQFKALMRGLASREETAATLEAIITDDKHPHWFQAWKTCCEYGYGKPAQALNITLEDVRKAIASGTDSDVIELAGIDDPDYCA